MTTPGARRSSVALVSPSGHAPAHGVECLASFLRLHGYRPTTFYLPWPFLRPYPPAVLERLGRACGGFDLVGISVLSNYHRNAVALSRSIRQHSRALLVWGGPHASACPEACLEHCDVAVCGEGELTLLELLEGLERGGELARVPGLCLSSGGTAQHSATRTPLAAERIPTRDHDSSRSWVLHRERLVRLQGRRLRQHLSSDYVTMSSRGCPFRCSYCVNSRAAGGQARAVRYRPEEAVVSELVRARRRMPFIGHVSFDDDAFMLRSPARLRSFAARYKRDVGLPFFVSGVNPRAVSGEKLDILIDAGMDRLRMGVQSGSAATRGSYQRPGTDGEILAAAHAIHQRRGSLMLVAYDLILDNPDESTEDRLATLDLLARLPTPYTLNLFSLTPYPGTALWDRWLATGRLREGAQPAVHRHYHHLEADWLNLLVLLHSLGRPPDRLMRLLLQPRLLARQPRPPQALFKAVQSLGLARRALDMLGHGDHHSLLRHLRANLLGR